MSPPTPGRLTTPTFTTVSGSLPLRLLEVCQCCNLANSSPVDHPPEERERFTQDPASYLQYRHRVENFVNQAQLIHWVGSDMNKAFALATEESMARRLARKPEIFKHLRPSYPVACRRVSPGPKYLECLVEDKLHFIPKGVKRVTETGIEDDDGTLREVDVIICATGFDT